MCIKDMIKDSKNMTVDRSIDMRLALSRNDDSNTAVKCFSVHKSASTPLWKIALWIAVGILIFIAIKKIKRKEE